MKKITQDNFVNETWEDGVYAIEFYTPMCVHCRLNAQILENNEPKMKERGITILKCDATKNSDLVKQLNILSVPFMLLVQVKHSEVNVKAIEKFNTLQGKQMLDKIYEEADSFTK